MSCLARPIATVVAVVIQGVQASVSSTQPQRMRIERERRKALSHTPDVGTIAAIQTRGRHSGILPGSIEVGSMPHSPEEKKRVLTRVRRMRGQLDALERALEAGADCGPVLQQLAALRGAVNGVMSGVLESHLREELGQPADSPEQRRASVDDAVALVRTYLK